MKTIDKNASLLAQSDRYIIYNEYEDAFLLDKKNNQTYYLGDYYGDPEAALIDNRERFAVVVGFNRLGVFEIVDKKLKLIDADIPDWVESLNQEDRKIEVICENGKHYVFDI